MSKTSKLFGAVALSAALAMGAVPAFAEVGVTDATDANLAQDGTASTEVKVETTVKQLNVTVPTAITIAANVGGGPATVPSDGVYKITNNGTIDVYINKSEATKDGKWTLSASPLAFGATSAATTGDVYMSLQPVVADESAESGWAAKKQAASSEDDIESIVITKTAAVNDYTADWMVAKKGTAATELNFKIDSSTSELKGVNATTAAAKAFTVKYTISATPNE